jgi:ankyrin repeat protein
MFSLWNKSSSTVVPESLAKQQVLLNGIRKQSVADVKSAIQNGADVNFKSKDDGTTPLAVAAMFSTKEIVGELINNGADVNATNKYGATVLMDAVSVEDPRLQNIKLLVEKGANVNAKDSSGKTVLKYIREPYIFNYLKPLMKTEVSEWSGGRRRKTHKRKSRKSKKTRKH